jgi:hypothetical protein
LRHHGSVTTPDAAPLPPDPARYDEVRNVAARKRGLEQPYIAGGEDPELAETLRRERPYVRILLAMVALIIATGFVLGFIGAILSGPAA